MASEELQEHRTVSTGLLKRIEVSDMNIVWIHRTLEIAIILDRLIWLSFRTNLMNIALFEYCHRISLLFQSSDVIKILVFNYYMYLVKIKRIYIKLISSMNRLCAAYIICKTKGVEMVVFIRNTATCSYLYK